MAKILIAEDETVSQKFAKKIVEKSGHSVYISPNGKHAYETLKVNQDFKLLITDFVMPEMDGRELVIAVRNDLKYKELPIIIMSAYITVKEISDLLEKGATAFQAKPLNEKSLLETVRKYVN